MSLRIHLTKLRAGSVKQSSNNVGFYNVDYISIIVSLFFYSVYRRLPQSLCSFAMTSGAFITGFIRFYQMFQVFLTFVEDLCGESAKLMPIHVVRLVSFFTVFLLA
jgi:hypothetical protein